MRSSSQLQSQKTKSLLTRPHTKEMLKCQYQKKRKSFLFLLLSRSGPRVKKREKVDGLKSESPPKSLKVEPPFSCGHYTEGGENCRCYYWYSPKLAPLPPSLRTKYDSLSIPSFLCVVLFLYSQFLWGKKIFSGPFLHFFWRRRPEKKKLFFFPRRCE